MPDVVCERLSVTFGKVTAVREVFSRFPAGRISVVVGPSGSGKSTLLKAIAGLARPSLGCISIGDRVLFDADSRLDVAPDERRLGFVFQSHALWPHMTAFANVAFPLKLRGVPRAAISRRVEEMLDFVGLRQRALHLPSQLSGGEAQRISLARALIYEPDVLLLDEPLSSIDAQLRAGLRDEIRRIQESLGTTMVYVTHDRTEAAYLGDELFVVRDGRLVESGPAELLTTRPRDPFTAQFLLDAFLHVGHVADGRLRLEGCEHAIELLGATPRGAGFRLFAIPPAAVELTKPSAERARILRRTVISGAYHYSVSYGGLNWSVPSPLSYSVGQEVGLAIRSDRLLEYATGDPIRDRVAYAVSPM